MLCIFVTASFSQEDDSTNVLESKVKNVNNTIPTFDQPDSNFTQSGSLKLSWTIKDSVLQSDLILFELQQSRDADFDSMLVRYQGTDLATYLSGLAEGSYHYRVRTIIDSNTSDWSEPILVVVKHHSLQLAFLLFGIGAVVFLSTVFVVVRGVKEEVH